MTREEYLFRRDVLRAFGVEGLMYALAGMARAEYRWRRQRFRLLQGSKPETPPAPTA